MDHSYYIYTTLTAYCLLQSISSILHFTINTKKLPVSNINSVFSVQKIVTLQTFLNIFCCILYLFTIFPYTEWLFHLYTFFSFLIKSLFLIIHFYKLFYNVCRNCNVDSKRNNTDDLHTSAFSICIKNFFTISNNNLKSNTKEQ